VWVCEELGWDNVGCSYVGIIIKLILRGGVGECRGRCRFHSRCRDGVSCSFTHVKLGRDEVEDLVCGIVVVSEEEVNVEVVLALVTGRAHPGYVVVFDERGVVDGSGRLEC